MPLLQQYRDVFQTYPEMQRVLGMMFEDIMAFHTEAVRFFAKNGNYLLVSNAQRLVLIQHPVFKQLWRSFWRDHTTRFKHLLEALVRHRALIERQAHLLHSRQYQHDRQHIETHILQYQNDREHIQREFAEAEKQRRREMHIAITGWLCSNDNTSTYESHCAARQHSQKSGAWVLKDPKISRWTDEWEPAQPVRSDEHGLSGDSWLTDSSFFGSMAFLELVWQSIQPLRPD